MRYFVVSMLTMFSTIEHYKCLVLHCIHLNIFPFLIRPARPGRIIRKWVNPSLPLSTPRLGLISASSNQLHLHILIIWFLTD